MCLANVSIPPWLGGKSLVTIKVRLMPQPARLCGGNSIVSAKPILMKTIPACSGALR